MAMKPHAPVLVLTIALASGACTLWCLAPDRGPATRIEVTRNSPDVSGAEQPANKGGYDPYYDRVNFCPGWYLPS